MKSTNLDLLLEEHNLGEQVGEKYFSYMYSIIQFTNFLICPSVIII